MLCTTRSLRFTYRSRRHFWMSNMPLQHVLVGMRFFKGASLCGRTTAVYTWLTRTTTPSVGSELFKFSALTSPCQVMAAQLVSLQTHYWLHLCIPVITMTRTVDQNSLYTRHTSCRA